jgi:hypothetical protein
MTPTRSLAAALVAVAALGTPAAAGPKTVGGTYDLTLPLPYTDAVTTQRCDGAPDGLSRDERKLTFRGAGKLSVSVQSVGDWIVELYDAGHRYLGGGQRVLLRSKSRATTVYVVTCNAAGGPVGTVHWAYLVG